MTHEVPRHVAIWMDPQQAILLAFETEPFDRSTPHIRGRGGSWSQDCIDTQGYLSKEQYYDAVLSHLKPQDEILILGPGEAKLELRHQIERQGGQRGQVRGLYYASRLANVEVIVPTSEAWRSEKVDEPQADTRIPRPNPRLAKRSGAQR
jgi:hypothetical protein